MRICVYVCLLPVDRGWGCFVTSHNLLFCTVLFVFCLLIYENKEQQMKKKNQNKKTIAPGTIIGNWHVWEFTKKTRAKTKPPGVFVFGSVSGTWDDSTKVAFVSNVCTFFPPSHCHSRPRRPDLLHVKDLAQNARLSLFYQKSLQSHFSLKALYSSQECFENAQLASPSPANQQTET